MIYVFHSRTIDTWGFEAYLEFVIEDQEAFENIASDITVGLVRGTFNYNEDYQEYIAPDKKWGTLNDYMFLGSEISVDGKIGYSISAASLSKILVNEKEHRIICVALAVHDGGASDTCFLDAFFSRFDIEPKEYEEYTSGNRPKYPAE